MAPEVVMVPIQEGLKWLLAYSMENQRASLGPLVMSQRNWCSFEFQLPVPRLGAVNIVICPETVIRPISFGPLLLLTVNHKAPSGPAAIAVAYPAVSGKVVTDPDVVMRPMALPPWERNHSAWSGPAVIPPFPHAP